MSDVVQEMRHTQGSLTLSRTQTSKSPAGQTKPHTSSHTPWCYTSNVLEAYPTLERAIKINHWPDGPPHIHTRWLYI